jgi:hypothetical protein
MSTTDLEDEGTVRQKNNPGVLTPVHLNGEGAPNLCHLNTEN